MNTGEDQELALYTTIKRELRKKRFGLIPECCRVYAASDDPRYIARARQIWSWLQHLSSPRVSLMVGSRVLNR